MDSSACELDDTDDEELCALIYQSSETAKAFKAGIAIAPINVDGNSKASNSLELECDQSVAQEKNKVNSSDGQQKEVRRPPAPSRDGQQTLRPSSRKQRSTVEAREVGNVNNTAKARSSVTPTQQKQVCMSNEAQTKKRVRVRRRCSAEGCTKQSVQNGVCIRHGAKHKPRAKCSAEGCTNQSVKNGVCLRHGAQSKKRVRSICTAKGCINQSSRKGGLCRKHGIVWCKCSAEGCTNQSVRKGVCIRHGAQKNRATCSSEGCTNRSQKGGLCRRHGDRPKCSDEGCSNLKLGANALLKDA